MMVHHGPSPPAIGQTRPTRPVPGPARALGCRASVRQRAGTPGTAGVASHSDADRENRAPGAARPRWHRTHPRPAMRCFGTRSTWTVGSVGANLAGRCYCRTGVDRRSEFEAWCAAVAATPRPAFTDSSRVTHLRAIATRYDGSDQRRDPGRPLPGRRERGRQVSAPTSGRRCPAAHGGGSAAV
jgi:hypothetical protein